MDNMPCSITDGKQYDDRSNMQDVEYRILRDESIADDAREQVWYEKQLAQQEYEITCLNGEDNG